jgi:hypothetical protein
MQTISTFKFFFDRLNGSSDLKWPILLSLEWHIGTLEEEPIVFLIRLESPLWFISQRCVLPVSACTYSVRHH